MTESISFPHLGIYLNHVGRGISIFGFEITFYGILTGLGILAGSTADQAECGGLSGTGCFCRARRTGGGPDVLYRF